LSTGRQTGDGLGFVGWVLARLSPASYPPCNRLKMFKIYDDKG
jgi:hypothetical protein